MQIIPAVDVLDGQVVRLLKGDYNQSTTYGTAPAEAARAWASAGATLVHVVDLEGARQGSPSLGLVEQIAATNEYVTGASGKPLITNSSLHSACHDL